MTALISVIIPTLNEAQHLAATIAQVQAAASQPLEIIVVDGGSQDGTIEIARSLNCLVLQSCIGRAAQMNAGANSATGEILLFLHADTQLPKQFDRFVLETLEQPWVIAGAFDLTIAKPKEFLQKLGLQLIELGVKLRSRFCQLPYGDQAIFLRAKTFRDLGGFPEIPIMEDFVLMRRIRKLGKVAIAPASVLTSARRWQKLGVLKTTLINQAIILGFYAGIDPERLRQWYRKQR